MSKPPPPARGASASEASEASWAGLLQASSLCPQTLLHELDFLHSVDSEPGQPCYSEAFLRRALRRYETCWIQFCKDKAEGEELEWAPPKGTRDRQVEGGLFCSNVRFSKERWREVKGKPRT